MNVWVVPLAPILENFFQQALADSNPAWASTPAIGKQIARLTANGSLSSGSSAARSGLRRYVSRLCDGVLIADDGDDDDLEEAIKKKTKIPADELDT